MIKLFLTLTSGFPTLIKPPLREETDSSQSLRRVRVPSGEGTSGVNNPTQMPPPIPEPVAQPFQPASLPIVQRAANDTLYDKFIQYKPPKFTGIEDAHLFLARIREFCIELGCNDERSIVFTGRRMEGIAKTWFWDYVQPSSTGMSWQQFSTLFMNRFVPERTRRARMREFESLVQGDMSVDEYATRFIELSRYAPGSIPDECTKIYRFISRLNAVYATLFQQREQDFNAVVDSARLMETKYISDGVIPGRRASRIVTPLGNLGVPGMSGSFIMGTQSSSSQFQGKGSTGRRKDKKKLWPRKSTYTGDPSSGHNTGSSRSSVTVCHKCGKTHKGGCNFDANTCFRCHQTGHFARDCPLPQSRYVPPQSSMGSVSRPHFSTSSTSDTRFVGQQGCGSLSKGRGQSFGQNSHAAGAQPRLFHLTQGDVQASNAVVAGVDLPANLIILDVIDFDVILGMDWLSTYDAEVHCKGKEIVFNILDGKKLIYRVDKNIAPYNLISAISARRMLGKACQGYLALVKDTTIEIRKVEEMSIVNEFLDVFLEELPGLPLDREIEFCIDLVPGIEPISMPPYVFPRRKSMLFVFGKRW
ncbi:uncharacterized protein LOC119369385 [Jatropha curcas]|uniref:uncharacterized protein LOC119369385 n=1 Tax=Jatropha curcas TaxID=180498 RepID=UPI0018947506|nr:uncharacterized protein LOC119369385 [Jatropha curcas]